MTLARIATATLLCLSLAFPGWSQDLEVEAFWARSNRDAPAIYAGEGYGYWKNYYATHSPAAFDLVFYRDYFCSEERGNTQFLSLGRIIGRPGDRLLIDGYDVVVNGTKLEQTPPAAGDPLPPPALNAYFANRTMLYESTPTGRRYGIIVPKKRYTTIRLDLVVPEGKYFILHDSRLSRTDGRSLQPDDPDACSSTTTRSHFVSAARILHRPLLVVSSPYENRADVPIK